MILRHYQREAIEEIRRLFQSGIRNILLHLSTGAGKTVIFSSILKDTAAKGNHCIMVVRGRQLVDQASQRLLREGVDHGVLMANHKHWYPDSKIQICSVDTLRSRNLRPNAKLIVVDECHQATSRAYHDLLNSYPDAFVLGVTATPFAEKPLSHIAEKIIQPITTKRLIEEKYLVDHRCWAPSTPDLSNVKISASTKDFKQDELALAMDKSALIGDIVSHWKRLSENRPTLCFATSLDHSKHIVQMFNSAGIASEHHDADTSLADRNAAIERLRVGTLKVISNVGIFCTGVDIPFLGCIVLARPTKSLGLHIQQLGRGTRPFPGKNDFLVLDHAGNCVRHGFITDEHAPQLDGKMLHKINSVKICKTCFMAYNVSYCPVCGPHKETDSEKRERLHVEGELVELRERDGILKEIKELKAIAKEKGYRRGWIFYKVKERYGLDVAEKYLPKRKLPPWLLNRYK